MAFPQTWSEELVAEWLELDNYFVKTGIPVATNKKGGRKGIDILGIRKSKRNLELFHVEVGGASKGTGELARDITKKFDGDVDEALKKVARGFNHELSECRLKRVYIHIWRDFSKSKYTELKEELGKKGIELKTFKELVVDIRKSIENWKEDNKTIKGNLPTLPGNLWLVKMLEDLESWELMC